MLWRIFLVIVGTLVVIFIASQIWGLYYRRGADASTAVDVGLVPHSPFYWVTVTAIFVGAGWLLKYWLRDHRWSASSMTSSHSRAQQVHQGRINFLPLFWGESENRHEKRRSNDPPYFSDPPWGVGL